MQQALKLQAHIKPARTAQSANPAGRGHPLSVLLQRGALGANQAGAALPPSRFISMLLPRLNVDKKWMAM